MMIDNGFVSGKFQEKSTLIIGKFDGLHLGHIELINYAKSIAKRNGSAVGVLTFDPSPIEYFEKNSKSFYLTSLQDKVSFIINQCGVDFVCIMKFDAHFSNLSGEEFVQKILKQKLDIQTVVVGENYNFGAKKQGDVSLLKQLGQKFNINVNIALLKKYESKDIISSGLIREYIQNGKIIKANELLGRNFKITGVVVRGSQIAGTKLQHKTANLFTEIRYVEPKYGVYAIFANLNGVRYVAIANFGIRPTFKHKTPHLEVHILNKDLPDFYGERISVEFIDYIREEKKFASIDELKQQIYQDCDLVLKKFSNLLL